MKNGNEEKKNKRRRRISYTEPLFDALLVLSDSDRLQIYDQLNYHFLKGKPLDYAACSDTARSIMAYIAPEIRKYQQKFDAGITEKKFTASTKAALCPNETSVLKRNEANGSVKKKNQKENILSINKNLNNIYNNVYQTNNRTRAHAYAREESIKNENDGDGVVVQLQKLQAADPETVSRTLLLIEELRQGEEIVKINGQPTKSSEIFSVFEQFFQKPGALEFLKYTYKQIDMLPGIRNPFKYTVSRLYNLMKVSESKTNEKTGTEREYSKEFLDSLFDNIEDGEI